MQDNTKITSNRRAALKALAAATGAAGLAALPSRWSKPSLMVGAVPAHAQTSSCIDYAIVFEATATSGVYSVGWEGSEPAVVETFSTLAWSCGTGCLIAAIGNNGNPGSTITFVITVFGIQLAPVVLSNGDEFFVVANRDTFAWDAATTLGAIDWNGIGCEEPLV